MCALFLKYLSNLGNPDDETLLFSPEEVSVTSTGQKSTSLGGETFYSLNLWETEKLKNDLENSRTNLSTYVSRILGMAKKVSGYREPIIIDEPVLLTVTKKRIMLLRRILLMARAIMLFPIC